jgi:large subunit ribosomal protein L5
MNRLQETYQTKIAPQLKADLGLENVHQIPQLKKIVVSVGVGRAIQDQKYLDNAVSTLRKVTGQQPIITKAKLSIASFKLREGQEIGAKVTLRGERMYDFLDRLISVVLPRIRDFRGLSAKAFDPQGNYSIGLNEQTIFPEISYEDANMTHGLQITLVTTAQNPAAGEALMRSLGLPLERKEK